MSKQKKPTFSALTQSDADLSERCRQLDWEIAYCTRKVDLLRRSNDYSHASLLAETDRRLDELTDCARQCRDQRAAAADQLRVLLSELPPGVARDILQYRYLEHLKWRQISELTSLDQRWLFRLHRRALDALC